MKRRKAFRTGLDSCITCIHRHVCKRKIRDIIRVGCKRYKNQDIERYAKYGG